LGGPFLTLQERRVLALALALVALGYGLAGWRALQAPELPVPPDSLDAAFFRLGSRLAADTVVVPPGPLDLNSATLEQLTTLPGIGPVRAAAILELRRSRGRLVEVDDLQAVRGIGPVTLERLRPLLCIDPPATPAGGEEPGPVGAPFGGAATN
jgi:competence ComEA-like helix-hairpin-helix protein